MGLFSNLPAPTKRPADGNGEGEATRAKAARTGKQSALLAALEQTNKHSRRIDID